MKCIIRDAQKNDLPEIVEILNQAIRQRSMVGFLREFRTAERVEWFEEHFDERYPILVAQENDKIAGWASISPYRKGRDALNMTVEVSYFIHADYRRKGIGSALLAEILVKAKKLGHETILAIIFHTNRGSIQLLEKNNFDLWGHMPQVAAIDGNRLDHLYYGRKL